MNLTAISRAKLTANLHGADLLSDNKFAEDALYKTAADILGGEDTENWSSPDMKYLIEDVKAN